MKLIKKSFTTHLYTLIIAGLVFLSVQANGQGYALGSVFLASSGSDGNCDSPAIASDSSGNFVIVWHSIIPSMDNNGYGIFARRYNSEGVSQSGVFMVNTYTFDHQHYAQVAMCDSGFVVTWESNGQDGSGYGIYAQRYNNQGVAQGAEFRVNTSTLSSQRGASICMSENGDFVIIWKSHAIYGQRYHWDGTTNGPEFTIYSPTGYSNIYSCDIACDSIGNFVATWSEDNDDGNMFEVYAQRFSSTGVAQGLPYHVNTFLTKNQYETRIDMDKEGNHVITWTSDGPSLRNNAIMAQRFDALGNPLGTEFKVNTYGTTDLVNPSVAMDDSGDFIITWDNIGGSLNYTVEAQRYNSQGMAQGTEFKVNVKLNHQYNSRVTMDSDGDYIVTWRSDYETGNNTGMVALRYKNVTPSAYDQNFILTESDNFQGNSIGFINATDNEVTETLSYSITGGNSNNLFSLNNATGEIILNEALTLPSYSFTVKIADQYSYIFITITVSNPYITSVTADKENNFKVYPNPAKGNVFIDIQGVTHVTMLDIYGNTVRTLELNNNITDISGIKPGLYFLEINTGNNKAIGKIIIE